MLKLPFGPRTAEALLALLITFVFAAGEAAAVPKVYIDITKKALVLLKRMDEPVIGLHKRLIGHLTRPELKELSRLLDAPDAVLVDRPFVRDRLSKVAEDEDLSRYIL